MKNTEVHTETVSKNIFTIEINTNQDCAQRWNVCNASEFVGKSWVVCLSKKVYESTFGLRSIIRSVVSPS